MVLPRYVTIPAELLDGAHQLSGLKGLRNIGISPLFHAPIAVKFFPLRGTKHHGNMLGGGIHLQLAAQFIAIHAWHHNIQHNHIRQWPPQMFEGFHPVPSGVYL